MIRAKNPKGDPRVPNSLEELLGNPFGFSTLGLKSGPFSVRSVVWRKQKLASVKVGHFLLQKKPTKNRNIFKQQETYLEQDPKTKSGKPIHFYLYNKTPAKHRDIFLPFRLHQLSHCYFGSGNRI